MFRSPTLRARCARSLADLGIPADSGSISIHDICDRLHLLRGRPIHLIPVVTRPGSPSGMWVATQAADYVFHVSPRQTSAVHVAHCVLHEIGHIMLDHRGEPGLIEQIGQLCEAIARDPASPVMLRTQYDDLSEVEAEEFATMASGRVGHVRSVTAIVRPVGDPDLHARLESYLSDGPPTFGRASP